MTSIKRNKHLTLILLLIGTSISNFKAQQNAKITALDKTKVCMVDDEYKGEQQLTTKIDGKIYYGCCDPCIQTLNSDSSFRFAFDPISNIKINKADAFIVKETTETDKVLYFENKANYQTYLNKIKTK